MNEEPITPAAFEGIDNAERELTLGKLIVEVHDWLNAAGDRAAVGDSPVPVWEFSSTRSYVADIVSVIRVLDLSRDLLLDAKLVLRLAERAVGQAVRRGQAAGELGSLATNNPGHNQTGYVPTGERLPSPVPYIGSGNTAHSIYKMVDGVTDQQFSVVLAEARAEENLSRSYVVRKIAGLKAGKKTEPRRDLVDTARDLSEQLRRVTVRLRTLTGDDRLMRNKAEVAARMRANLDTAVAVCTELKKTLDED